MEGSRLCDRFNRLYALVENKMATVANMYFLGGVRMVRQRGGVGVCLHGKKHVWGELCELVTSIVLQDAKGDR